MSYLPELRSYLDDLLRTRERLQAMTTADDWAKREAMPSEEEIARLRRLIRRVGMVGTGHHHVRVPGRSPASPGCPQLLQPWQSCLVEPFHQ